MTSTTTGQSGYATTTNKPAAPTVSDEATTSRHDITNFRRRITRGFFIVMQAFSHHHANTQLRSSALIALRARLGVIGGVGVEILLAGDREAGCCETGLDAGPECFERAHGGVVECTQRLVLSVLVESTKIIDRLKSTSCNCQRSSSECRTLVTSSSQTMVHQSASM